MKKLLSVILVSAVLAGCSPKAPLSIDGKGFRHQKLSELPDSLIKSRTFVKFDSTDPEFMFNSAEDVKIKNGLIYVKYRYNRDSKVLVFDIDGMPAFKVDRKGEGPEEYTQVSAFDIDGKGRIHIIDGRTDELLVYGPGGGFIKRTKLPFEADDVKCLSEGGYLFALCTWNTRQCSGNKAAVTDSLLNVKASYLKYDQYHDDRAIVASNGFTQAGGGITAFNEHISNTVRMFDDTGRLVDSCSYDFGPYNVPDEDKKDVENNIYGNTSYRCLSGPGTVGKRFAFGSIYDGKRGFSFIADRDTGTIYTDQGAAEACLLSMITGGTAGGAVLSCLTPDMPGLDKVKNIPEDVLTHLENENFVLCITELKG